MIVINSIETTASMIQYMYNRRYEWPPPSQKKVDREIHKMREDNKVRVYESRTGTDQQFLVLMTDITFQVLNPRSSPTHKPNPNLDPNPTLNPNP
jgi:hypothetical protein